MSDLDELKNLAWTVQSTVAEPGFESLVVRSRHRRNRRRALAATVTATAAVAVTALVSTDPLGGTTPDPAATGSSSAPTTPVLPPVRPAREIIDAATAAITDVWTGPAGVIGVWGACLDLGSDCQNLGFTRAADGRFDTGPVTRGLWLIGGDQRYGVLLDLSDPQATSPTAVVLSDTGQSVLTLRRHADTGVVDDGEVLLRDDTGPLLIDPGRRSIRRLVLPGDLADGRFGQVARDGAGGIWLTAGPQNTDGVLLHSTDDGRTWSRTALGSIGPWSASFAVSPDGRTVVLAADTERAEPVKVRTRVSYDGGRTWSELPQRLYLSGMAAFDDATVVLNTTSGPDSSTPRTVYRLDHGHDLRPVTGVPGRFGWLGSAGSVLYGLDGDLLNASTDHGSTWQQIRLR